MGTRTEYEPGTFCWVNMSATDLDAAKRFYAGLFGWHYDDQPNNGGTFAMARRHHANVAALYPREEREQAHGPPSHWNNYVSVSDADDTASRAQALGGTVLDEPYDVADAGRTAVLADPTGAVFWVWQPRKHIGAGRVNDAGCFTWNELGTTDVRRAAAFYSGLFGWRFEQVDTGGGPDYWTIGHDGAAMGRNGGMRELTARERAADVHPHWMPYFTVDSAAAAAGKARDTGGSVLHGPAPAGGTVAVLEEPTGAVFAVFEGEVDN